MSLSFFLAAPKDLRKEEKKVGGGGRRSIVEADSRSAATCMEIQEDILMEILVRLPMVSLMRFKCVSRLWSYLISSRYFTNLFFNFSSSTKLERRVFAYLDDNYMLFSSSLSNLCPTASIVQLNRDLTFPGIKGLEFVNALRGLMCFIVGREIQIINLTTRQVLSLPLVNSSMLLDCDFSTVQNYFGYDHVNDEYKVLSIISSGKRIRSDTQILVLGAGASWRNTKSLSSPPPHHLPRGQGIFINSVLYYGAWSHEKRFVLMSFDFNSEEFNLIKFPMEYPIMWDVSEANLMNYQDQVALFDGSCLYTKSILYLWLLEDAKESKWSHKLELSLELSNQYGLFKIRGTGRSGEVTSSHRYMNGSKITRHFIYDLERNRTPRSFLIETPNRRFGHLQTNFWVDVESIMYLEV